MPTPTYTQISSITLAAASATVNFSNIPQKYKDLVLVTSPISAGTYASISIRFNGDSGSNYPSIWAVDGPSSFAGTYSGLGPFWSGWAVNGTVMSITQIMDYSAVDKHKPVLNRTNKFDSEGNGVGISTYRWASTAAITDFSIYSSGTYSNPFAIGSTFTLYGIVG